MGPHPETPVDVQKYIGSCLITQQPRSKRKSSCPNRGRLPLSKDGRYVPSGSKCGGFGGMTNYAWTGVPLISVARQGKCPHPGKSRCPTRNSGKHDFPRVESPVESCSLDELLPLSRLAIHAQGAPLILSPKDPDKNSKDLVEGYSFKGRDFYLGEGSGRLYMLMPGCNAEDVLAGRGERTSSGSSYVDDVASSPSQSDCISTTSEDSGTSENGLPRIIKPRKRRKKDRRLGEGSEAESPSSIVTLKPYRPLCYRYGYKSFSSSKPPSSEEDASEAFPKGTYPHPPSPRCRCPHCVPPPSTLLTPPDSPDGVRVAGPFVADSRPDGNLEDSASKSQNAVVLTSSHPPSRPWIQVSTQNPQSSCSFTVMCYNILCDKYATRQMYGYCPNWALDWSYRKRNILNEIVHYKADIISLQEVETEQFYKYFLPELKKEGYDGIFSPKSRAKTMSENERKHVDGCAIFYKTDKFFLLKEHLVEFNQLAMANAEGSDDMLNRVMTKDNIGLAALLQTRMGAYELRSDVNPTSQTLLVCTAHIHWDPEYSDVKLIQTMMLMHELKAFVDDILQKCNIPVSQKSDPNIIPLLLCGDFNSLPDSGVIEYLSSGRVSTSHIDFKEIAYRDCLSKLGNTANSNEFAHPFQITRAYNDGIMPFTNYSYDFKGVIDYVFYSKLHMNVLGVLGPIDTSWLEENHIHGCPHPHVPSDHFPIVVELQLYPTTPLHPPPPNGVTLHR